MKRRHDLQIFFEFWKEGNEILDDFLEKFGWILGEERGFSVVLSSTISHLNKRDSRKNTTKKCYEWVKFEYYEWVNYDDNTLKFTVWFWHVGWNLTDYWQLINIFFVFFLEYAFAGTASKTACVAVAPTRISSRGGCRLQWQRRENATMGHDLELHGVTSSYIDIHDWRKNASRRKVRETCALKFGKKGKEVALWFEFWWTKYPPCCLWKSAAQEHMIRLKNQIKRLANVDFVPRSVLSKCKVWHTEPPLYQFSWMTST